VAPGDFSLGPTTAFALDGYNEQSPGRISTCAPVTRRMRLLSAAGHIRAEPFRVSGEGVGAVAELRPHELHQALSDMSA